MAETDTLTVRVAKETELDADSADLTVVIDGATCFAGDEAFKKAKELRDLVEALGRAGIPESSVKLRSVAVNSTSFAVIKSSSARYTVTLKDISLDALSAAIGTIAACKGAELQRLNWNYGRIESVKQELRDQAIADALDRARRDARILGVELLAVHTMHEESQSRSRNPEYIGSEAPASLEARRQRVPDIGIHLGNSTTVALCVFASFRIGPLAPG